MIRRKPNVGKSTSFPRMLWGCFSWKKNLRSIPLFLEIWQGTLDCYDADASVCFYIYYIYICLSHDISSDSYAKKRIPPQEHPSISWIVLEWTPQWTTTLLHHGSGKMMKTPNLAGPKLFWHKKGPFLIPIKPWYSELLDLRIGGFHQIYDLQQDSTKWHLFRKFGCQKCMPSVSTCPFLSKLVSTFIYIPNKDMAIVSFVPYHWKQI